MTTIDAENLERKLMKDLFLQKGITQFGFTKVGSYARNDGWYINTRNQKIRFEVKVREIPSYKYPSVIINKDKYLNLLKEPRPYLFVFYTDRKVLVQNLKNITVGGFEYNGPKATYGPADDLATHSVVTIDIHDESLMTY